MEPITVKKTQSVIFQKNKIILYNKKTHKDQKVIRFEKSPYYNFIINGSYCGFINITDIDDLLLNTISHIKYRDESETTITFELIINV